MCETKLGREVEFVFGRMWVGEGVLREDFPNLYTFSTNHHKPISFFDSLPQAQKESPISWNLHFRQKLFDHELDNLAMF